MEHLLCHLKGLNRDLLADIMARLDGSTLASAACTCSDFCHVARDQRLWKQLCHSTWPSTALEEAQHLISSPHVDGFDKFYADSYPLILCDQSASQSTQPPICPELKTHVSPSDFVSLVDVYYQKKCILSRVLDGIPEAVDMDVDDADDIGCNWDVTATDHQRWFADCPFKLDLLSFNYNERNGNEIGEANNGYANHRQHHNANDDNSMRALPSISLVEDGKLGGDFCKKLEEDMRLSWVLFDKKRGKAVNITSWKPLLVQRSWPSDGDFVMRFGCIIPVEQSMLPYNLAECVILARCGITEREGCVRWKEISMTVNDMAGMHVCGRKSLMVLNQALHCLRSKNHCEVEKGYGQYERKKREMKRRMEFKETLADSICISIEIVIFVAFCYACILFF
ncbi:hypothetical protein L1049_021803 [Liquidambar formosana]|uniref:F-box domain-containing protein n=1 Tax=Liquidambar formosana TaxID=63359 RepID=A0AAP0WNF1_LIQFO